MTEPVLTFYQCCVLVERNCDIPYAKHLARIGSRTAEPWNIKQVATDMMYALTNWQHKEAEGVIDALKLIGTGKDRFGTPVKKATSVARVKKEKVKTAFDEEPVFTS